MTRATSSRPFFPRQGSALALLSGALLILSFPKYGHWSVAFVALSPLLVALAGQGVARAASLAYVAGVVSSLGLLYWISLVITQYGGLSRGTGIGVMVLLCLAYSLFTAAFGALVARYEHLYGPRGLLLAPFALVAVEILRSYVLFDFPWCLLGYSQAPNVPLIQIASIAAVYGVSFLVAGGSAVVAYAIVSGSVRPLGVYAALILATWGWGALRIERPENGTESVPVGLVQANILQDEKWDPARAASNVQRHLELAERAAASGAKLVVLPESALPFYYDRDPGLRRTLEAFVREQKVYLLFGNDDWVDEPSGEERAFVGAKMLDPDGRLVLRYHKVHLVPFGEYVPLKDLLHRRGVGKLVAQVSDFSAGDTATTGNVLSHRIGAFICYEAIFPDFVRGFSEGGSELLVNITNDAWYGRTSAPYQHLSMAVFRAVENRKYLVRAANTGISAIVDPYGRIQSQTPLYESAVLLGRVPFLQGETFYARHGDLFAWSCLVSSLLLAWPWRRREKG